MTADFYCHRKSTCLLFSLLRTLVPVVYSEAGSMPSVHMLFLAPSALFGLNPQHSLPLEETVSPQEALLPFWSL